MPYAMANQGLVMVPPKETTDQPANSDEVKTTKRVPNPRLHATGAMEKLRTFRILQGVVPLGMTEQVERVFTVCYFLCHLQPLHATK